MGDGRDAGLVPQLGKSPDIGNGNLPQCTCLENYMDRGAWWAVVSGAAKSRKWLNTHARSDDKNVDEDVEQHLLWTANEKCVSLGYTFWCCNKNPTIIWFNKVRVFPFIRVPSIGLIRVCQSFSSHKSPKYRADKSICDTGSFLSTLVGTFIWFHDSYSSMAIMSICQLIRGKVCFIFLKMWPNFYFTCYWPEFWPMATDKEW